MQYRVYCKQSDFIQSFVKSYMQKKTNTTVLFKDEHPYPFEINAKRLFFLVLCSKGVSETTLHNKCIIF